MRKVKIDLPSLHKEGRLQGRSTEKERHTHPFDLKRHAKMICWTLIHPITGRVTRWCDRMYGSK
jgi:hypothetical protein